MIRSHLVRRQLAAGLIATSIFACAATAVAAPLAKDLPSIEVRYSDLDLSKAAGMQVLYRRIRAAAHDVCGPMELRSPRITRSWTDCYRASVDKAVATANRPMLTALHLKESTGAT